MSQKIRIPLIKPYVGVEELEAIKKVLESGYLTQGSRVKEFEKKFAEYVGIKYALATTSCTTALELALLCLHAYRRLVERRHDHAAPDSATRNG